jgi:hypothetical protein
MPVPVKDIQFDQIGTPEQGDTFINDGPSGGGGGGIPTGGTGGGISTPTPVSSNLFIFNISSNETSFTTTVNGQPVGDNKRIRITKESLTKENKKIEIKKNGFFTGEYYILELVNDGIPLIKNTLIGNKLLGIDTKDVVLTKYNNDEVVGLPQSIRSKVSSDLSFKLVKTGGSDVYEEPNSYQIKINVSGKGSPVSVLKNGNKSAEFFPEIGNNTYEDVEGTSYKIRSSDLSLYKITSIVLTAKDNQPKEIIADSGESLDIDLTLNKEYTVDIVTDEVFQGGGGLDPQISLVKTDPRKYNINKKTGVPIMIRKNEDVQVITIVVGEDVLEFDNLDDADVVGITIPHDVFKQIGKYNIKLYPFSFDDYENQIRPDDEPEVIKPKSVIPKVEITEEIKIPKIEIKDKYNPYKLPVISLSDRIGTVGIIPGESRGILNISENQFDNLSTNDRINLGSTRSLGGSLVLDGRINDRQINER